MTLPNVASPGHSQLFNVAHRKAGGLGIQNHVKEVETTQLHVGESKVSKVQRAHISNR